MNQESEPKIIFNIKIPGTISFFFPEYVHQPIFVSLAAKKDHWNCSHSPWCQMEKENRLLDEWYQPVTEESIIFFVFKFVFVLIFGHSVKLQIVEQQKLHFFWLPGQESRNEDEQNCSCCTHSNTNFLSQRPSVGITPKQHLSNSVHREAFELSIATFHIQVIYNSVLSFWVHELIDPVYHPGHLTVTVNGVAWQPHMFQMRHIR